ncbi:hypothetical protein RHSIM_RhsimUnG0065900 [Rhododendron simsii]|uniref:Uncharacterized protein n=1 Tax=Rhododendron simsii TaxID=118357 RepID=A0A834FVR7_RHOSS|nr:hypothetical protein RHSIM_RhsimUnG0065900 [Rhododendron simsii]
MEQSTSSSRSKTESYLPTLFGPKEIEVSQILLDIPNLIQHEFPSQFHVIWGGKRKRSAIDSSPSQEEEKRPKEERESEKRPKVMVEASSPTTPFSFSPSESDEKSKLYLKKPSSKTTREERLEIIEELTQQRELLKGEIESVKSYYNKLKAINFDLKAKKRELEKFGLELREFNRVENQDYYYMLYQQPSNVDQTAYGSQTIEHSQQHPYGQISPFLSSGSGSGEVKEMGPLCIPDLNASASGKTFGVGSSQPLDRSRGLVVVVKLDDNKARASEARRRRMIKMKEMKGSFVSIKSLKCR